LHSNHLIQKVSKIEKTGSKLFNWALKKIAWNGLKMTLDYFDLNLYKTVKIKTVTTILTKIYLKKEIIILILAFL
jgi:hypothetical protein